jgi:GntP family gluconate:H+ symporter
MKKEDRHLPALWLSLMPIILPVILISGNTITKAIQAEGMLLSLFSFMGDPNIALTLGAVVALGTLAWKERDRQNLKSYVTESLKGGGLIILITSMGGALGGILQQTGIGIRVQELASDYHIAILPLAFFVTVVIRTAQGSATVAMITSVGILGGLATMGDLAFHRMNDSGFWVVCTMSGMTEGETLKSHSAVLSIMGFVGLFVVMILAKIFPLI